MGKKSEAQAKLEKQAKITEKWPYKGKYFQVRSQSVEISGRPTKVWDLVVHPGAVAIIPVDDKGNLLLVEQWRRAVGKIILEIPAGLLEEGERPIDCAQRELQEETGYKAKTLTPFGGLYSAPGSSNEYVHLFLAKELIRSPLQADDTDSIDLRVLSLEEAKKMIEDGTICDSKTIAGILKYAEVCT